MMNRRQGPWCKCFWNWAPPFCRSWTVQVALRSLAMKLLSALMLVEAAAQADWCRWVPFASQQYVPQCGLTEGDTKSMPICFVCSGCSCVEAGAICTLARTAAIQSVPVGASGCPAPLGDTLQTAGVATPPSCSTTSPQVCRNPRRTADATIIASGFQGGGNMGSAP